MYRRNHPIGRCKIQDCWNPKVFQVVEGLDTEGRVYRIRPQQEEGPSYNIHRSELKHLPRAPTTTSPPEVEAHQPSASQQQEDDTSEGESSLIADWVPIPTCPDPQDNLGSLEQSRHTGPEHLPAPEQQLPLEPTLSESPPSPAELSSATSPPHFPSQAVTPPSRELQLRRSTRSTAGHHPNPFNLPQTAISHASEQSIPDCSRPHTEL